MNRLSYRSTSIVRSGRNSREERSLLVQGSSRERKYHEIGEILANIYYLGSNSKILHNSTGRSPTLKVIVLRDYLELSESPQHRIHANILPESIWRTLVAPNTIKTITYPHLPFTYLLFYEISTDGSQLRRGAHVISAQRRIRIFGKRFMESELRSIS